jgi:hypothetical protein
MAGRSICKGHDSRKRGGSPDDGAS